VDVPVPFDGVEKYCILQSDSDEMSIKMNVIVTSDGDHGTVVRLW
jgi:hypothetical protein